MSELYGLKPLLVVKVGSALRPASDEAIADMEESVRKALNGDGVLVTHHNVTFETHYVAADAGGLFGDEGGDEGGDDDAMDDAGAETCGCESCNQGSYSTGDAAPEASTDVVNDIVSGFLSVLSKRGKTDGDK